MLGWQVLGLRATATVPSGLRSRLSAFIADVPHDRPVLTELELAVSAAAGGYRVDGGRGVPDTEFHLSGVIENLHGLACDAALDAAAPELVVAGLIAVAGGRRTLVAGEDREALALVARELLGRSAAVEGLGDVAVEAGRVTVVAMPIVFGRDPGEPLDGISSVLGADGLPRWALRPDALGGEWRARTGAPELIVELRCDGGAGARVAELAEWEAASVLGRHRVGVLEDPRRAVAAVARLVSGVPSRRLVTGTVGDAASALSSPEVMLL